MVLLWVVAAVGGAVVGVGGSAALPTHPPPTQHPSHTERQEDFAGTSGFLSKIFPEGLKRTQPSSLQSLPSSQHLQPSNPASEILEPAKALVKRSIEGQEPYEAYRMDPGFESYMHSIHFDPMNSWGKRGGNRRNGGFESYNQNYPTQRDTTPEEYYYGQEDGDAGKQREYAEVYYPQHYYAEEVKKSDPFLDVYLPNHFMHSFKRSINPYFLNVASSDWKRAPNDMGAQGFHEGIFTHNFGDFSPVKRNKRSVDSPQETERKMSVDSPQETGRKRSVDSPQETERKRSVDSPQETERKRSVDSPQETERKRSVDSPQETGRKRRDVDAVELPEKRRMGMGASGFHGDTFSHGFGDFSTMKKRMGASGFHGDTFSQGFGDFSTMKKRYGASGFHGDTFSQGFGDFSTMKKRRYGLGDNAFHGGDTFSQGFGDFSTMKKRMGASGFHGDTFSQGFGDFSTMKKRRMGMGASGFHGDTFNQGFGDFSTMKKRYGASGFHGDTFSQGFGDFSTMKKRRMGMGASGFHGDTFNQGFGDFSTMKKRYGASGFHGDTFSQGFGDFSTMKKRMGASGFHGDTFSQGFGDFSTMKKRPDTKPTDEYLAEYERATQNKDTEEKEVDEEEKEKETTRKKRETDEDDNEDLNYESSLNLAELGALHQQREMSDRFKRNLVESGMVQVELRPPVESDVSNRRRREIQGSDPESQEGSARSLYKRSAEWNDGGMLSGGFGEFDTMRRR